MAGAAFAMSSQALRAETPPAERTTVSKEGLVRTVLERYENEAGEEFNLILDTFPAGIVIPVHHHPSVGLNYVLDGVAETQFEGDGGIRAGCAVSP